MARFIKNLNKLSFIDGRKWRVESDVVFESDILKRVVTVPAGTLTDFASIPRPLWPVYPPSRYGQPATVHDWLYTTQECSRREADEVFLEAMKCCGAPYLRRYAFYWSLRAFGWAAWSAHKKK